MSRIGNAVKLPKEQAIVVADTLEDLVKKLHEAESNVEMLNQQIIELQNQIISFNLKGDFKVDDNTLLYDFNKRRSFLLNRINSLDDCIEQLWKTSHQYYSSQGKELEGWKLLLYLRNNLVKLRDKDWREIEKL